jgi:hypothetical protein
LIQSNRHGSLGEQDCAKLIRTILNDEKIENILVPNSYVYLIF